MGHFYHKMLLHNLIHIVILLVSWSPNSKHTRMSQTDDEMMNESQGDDRIVIKRNFEKVDSDTDCDVEPPAKKLKFEPSVFANTVVVSDNYRRRLMTIPDEEFHILDKRYLSVASKELKRNPEREHHRFILPLNQILYEVAKTKKNQNGEPVDILGELEDSHRVDSKQRRIYIDHPHVVEPEELKNYESKHLMIPLRLRMDKSNEKLSQFIVKDEDFVLPE